MTTQVYISYHIIGKERKYYDFLRKMIVALTTQKKNPREKDRGGGGRLREMANKDK
jgi:hypothetical protein